jgi:hypothetical protein
MKGLQPLREAVLRSRATEKATAFRPWKHEPKRKRALAPELLYQGMASAMPKQRPNERALAPARSGPAQQDYGESHGLQAVET